MDNCGVASLLFFKFGIRKVECGMEEPGFAELICISPHNSILLLDAEK